MNNLKVGDRVRLVTTDHGYICDEDDDRFFQVGCMGTVTDTNWTDGAIVAMYGFGDPVYFSYDEFELVEAAQTSNQTPSLVQKTTPKNDDSGERDSQPMLDNNAWFERGELPEVGTVCEYRHNFTGNWNEGEVVAQLGLEVVICDHNWHTSHWLTLDKLRPIKKTAEEIEAEGRKKAVGAVEEQILEQMGKLNVRNLAEHIVDTLGLRLTKEGK